jgi:hypothetical protein
VPAARRDMPPRSRWSSCGGEVAHIFYEQITTPVPDAAQTAQDLHHAIREIRAMYRATPALWAAHIHVCP